MDLSIINKYKKESVALILFLIAYVPIFLWMWDRWFARDSYYSHGILIPFVSGFLIWQLKDDLKKIPPQSSPWGMNLVILGLSIYFFASIFRIYFISGFSMLIVLCGLVLYFLGEKIFTKISFPLAFLVFMVPLSETIIIKISFGMKLFAAQIAANILNGLNMQAIREGSVIRMRNANVVVDDVCSGLRSLISLTALGAIFAYWMKASMFKRMLLFLSTIPIAIVTNVCRIIFLSSVSEIWGPQYAEGFVHDASGFVVFGIAFILLFAIGKLLE